MWPLLLLLAQSGNLVDIGGRRLHLHCTGEGSPVVVVTGAGYSFDWILVQNEVAKFTRVCTYDPAGFAWSDPGSGPLCEDRVNDLHKLLEAAQIKGSVVLAGLSYGALVARLYASKYEVAGIVIVDHAFLDPGPKTKPNQGDPVILYQEPIVLAMEDVSNFGNLPKQSRDWHRWADSLKPPMPSVEDARSCSKLLEENNLGNMPLAVVSTLNDAPNYAPLQKRLLALSTNSRQYISTKSFHAIEIDEPEIVVKAIREVVFKAK